MQTPPREQPIEIQGCWRIRTLGLAIVALISSAWFFVAFLRSEDGEQRKANLFTSIALFMVGMGLLREFRAKSPPGTFATDLNMVNFGVALVLLGVRLVVWPIDSGASLVTGWLMGVAGCSMILAWTILQLRSAS